MALLQSEFPSLQFITLKGYEIQYPQKGKMGFKMLLQSKKIINRIHQEHLELEKIIDKYHIDMVISDNRYGLWSDKISCIFITHQIFIKASFGENLLEKITKKYIAKFTKCWIPDFENEPNLSGDLSHKKHLDKAKFEFIGPLSRLSDLKNKDENKVIYDVMVIISGPEPQRSVFEDLVINQLKNCNLKAVVLRGKPEDNKKIELKESNIVIKNHLSTSEFLEYLNKSKLVVARSGYSTIMDLFVLQKKAILVPTPGQTEQEYLAKYHFEKRHFYYQKQKDFNLMKAVKNVANYEPKKE